MWKAQSSWRCGSTGSSLARSGGRGPREVPLSGAGILRAYPAQTVSRWVPGPGDPGSPGSEKRPPFTRGRFSLRDRLPRLVSWDGPGSRQRGSTLLLVDWLIGERGPLNRPGVPDTRGAPTPIGRPPRLRRPPIHSVRLNRSSTESGCTPNRKTQSGWGGLNSRPLDPQSPPLGSLVFTLANEPPRRAVSGDLLFTGRAWLFTDVCTPDCPPHQCFGR